MIRSQRSTFDTADGSASRPRLLATATGAVGVVFGDIGTSPLYTLQVAAEGQQGAPPHREDTFGVVSLIVWALVLAVSVKYVTFVMRADNRGEGGILALLALLPRRAGRAHIGVMALFVVAGAALLFGDGMITPAISVLSAFEGLRLAEPSFEPYIVPLTCVVLLALFAIQSRGTGAVGKIFGPIMLVWFFTIGTLGFKELLKYPAILGALSPHWGARYFTRHGLHGLGILGVVVLAITGGEALYADMGHFGVRPIRLSWFALVLPSLILCYLGQGALVLRDSHALANPFFAMAPGPATYALVVLAAAATTIASQALISGVFSLTHQAVQLEYFPRVAIKHTSRETEGQIYVPLMNWGLMVACVALVLSFKQSARLAGAYGIAVSGTMAITSMVFFDVTRKTWRWPLARSVPLLLLFLSFDLPFFGANLLKLLDGGYIPLLVGAAFFAIMVNWHVGREVWRERMEDCSVPLAEFLASLESSHVARVPGTAIYLSTTREVPYDLAMQARRIRSIMKDVVLLTVAIEHEPQVQETHRHEVESLGNGFVRVTIHFGYMEIPEVPPALTRALEQSGIPLRLDDATYCVGRQTFIAGKGGKMGRLGESLFAFLSRNAKSAVDHYGLPAERVVELGSRIDL
jgi:KUP system potassium uptake protein